MTDTMTDVANPRKAAPGSVAAQLIEQARAEGVSLVGPGSPLAALTKQVLETALEAEAVDGVVPMVAGCWLVTARA